MKAVKFLRGLSAAICFSALPVYAMQTKVINKGTNPIDIYFVKAGCPGHKSKIVTSICDYFENVQPDQFVVYTWQMDNPGNVTIKESRMVFESMGSIRPEYIWYGTELVKRVDRAGQSQMVLVPKGKEQIFFGLGRDEN